MAAPWPQTSARRIPYVRDLEVSRTASCNISLSSLQEHLELSCLDNKA
jgi:hypothetical protein